LRKLRKFVVAILCSRSGNHRGKCRPLSQGEPLASQPSAFQNPETRPRQLGTWLGASADSPLRYLSVTYGPQRRSPRDTATDAAVVDILLVAAGIYYPEARGGRGCRRLRCFWLPVLSVQSDARASKWSNL
jgi:hypothetical protein